MKFDHSKLLGRIRECGYTQKTLAEAIGMNVSTLNRKLNNEAYFSTTEISKIRMVLGIAMEELGEYFYCLKSS